MKRLYLILFFFLSAQTAWSEDRSDCRFYINCDHSGGSSRSSAQSLPSSSSAANLNPGNISQVRGVGLETLFQVNNPVGFSLVTGNGKIGALISPTLENSFFGNRSIELDNEFYQRNVDQKRYKNKKLTMAVGLQLFDKRFAALDIGVSLKRNPLIKKLNPGVGAGARLSIFNFGIYYYKDDVQVDISQAFSPYSGIPYNIIYGSNTYQEKFSVLTYTVGTSIRNLSLDVGVIKTKYKFYSENTIINIYSSSLSYGKFLFNLALRNEYSPNLKYQNGTLEPLRKKSDTYLGVQYLFNKHLMAGLHHNNYLLNELSATLTLFF